MKEFSSEHIKNIALLGHGGSGKTTFADALLYCGKVIDKIGKISDGTTAMDFDAEEKKRHSSIALSVCPIETENGKINLLDAPGLFDFEAGKYEALNAADSAVVVISGKSGLTVGAKQSFELIKKHNKPAAVFVGKLDSTHAHFYRVISILTGAYGAVICPVVIPYLEGETVKCFVDLLNDRAYIFDGINRKECEMPQSEEITQMKDIMLEAVASMDEQLMEKYFGGEKFTTEEKISALKKGVLSGEIYPVFAGIQQTGAGIPLFFEIIDKIMPVASECAISAEIGGTETELKADNTEKTAAFVFKTVADPFVGKLSYFKVISGTLTADTKLKNSRTGEEVKTGKLMWQKLSKQEDAQKVYAGDICVASKLNDVATGDTLSEDGTVKVVFTAFPAPAYRVAVFPENKGDEEKIAAGLARICEEDKTVGLKYDNETHETILSGLGEQHIDVIFSKLKQKFGIGVKSAIPSVAYRETIRKSAKVQGRYKKQSGGHGQFGDVWIEFEPCDSEELVFEEKVFGGAVPKNFFPAVEKGLRDSAAKGVLAGYPMVGVKATLVDGSYHPVDSSEMSFKTAASLAYKEGIPQASPVLLEPIGMLTVITEDDCLGDVIGEINRRRGRVIGMEPTEDKRQAVTSEIPISQTSDFAISMRSITQGRATFSIEFLRYEQMPENLAREIIDNRKEA